MMFPVRNLAFNVALGFLAISGTRAHAATGHAATIAFVGHGFPGIPTVAPGQIVTVIASGFPIPSAVVNAQQVPLPTMLAGITATLNQTLTSQQQVSAPLVSVAPVGNCVVPGCAPLVAVTVQIPTELLAFPPGSLQPPNNATLTIADQSGDSATIELAPAVDSIHILTPGDAGLSSDASSIVAHGDGSLVTPDKPALPGEELVAYATGLGTTTSQPPTGTVTPTPAPQTKTPFQLSFNFAPNAPPWKNLIQQPAIVIGTPIFTGLTPGNVGLYQLNFIVPSPPIGTIPCAAEVFSNITLTVIGAASFDGAPFCVALS